MPPWNKTARNAPGGRKGPAVTKLITAAAALVIATGAGTIPAVPTEQAAIAAACPLVVAHRGLHSPYASVPENSLASADAAFREAGVHSMETDVKFSSDGVPVIMHDDTVDAMTTSSGKVSSYTAAQLTSMRLVTTRGGSTLSGQYIPTLAQLLARVKADGGRLIAEVSDQDGHGITAAEAQTITGVLDQSGNWPGFVTVASLDTATLLALQQADPAVTGHTELLAVHPVHPDPVRGDLMEDVDGTYLTQADVQEFHAAGENVGAWITDNATGWSTFTRWGVDQVTTDDTPGLVSWQVTGCTRNSSIQQTGYVAGYHSLCLDDYRSSAANGNPIDLYTCNGTAAQAWTFQETQATAGGTEVGYLVSSNGRCANDAGYGGRGAKVVLWACTGTSNEEWQYWPSYREYSLYSGGRTVCLNDPAYSARPGTQQIVWTCQDTANEHYSLPS